jgi:phosphinothricin acetyltransferase
MDWTIEAMKNEDWASVQSIYREGIATGNATFETVVPEWDEWDKNHLPICRLIARSDNRIIGWAALSAVSNRPAYSGVCEVSIYITNWARGCGVGRALLGTLIEESERMGIWILQAGIFPENADSIALTRACGFREVGYRERIGQMNGVWRNVVLVERRSKEVGI